MVAIVKVFISFLVISFGFAAYFIINEFNKFRKSEQYDDSSILEKFMISTIAMSCIFLLIIFCLFCFLLLFSDVSLTLPF